MQSIFFDALRLATQAHDGQWRKGGDGKNSPPYVVHCIEVAEVITLQGGIEAPAVQAVALLHDTLEDTTLIYEDLHKQFGKYVADCVQKLTLPVHVQASTDYSQVKHAFQMESIDGMDRFTKLIKFADKTCNVRDLVRYPPGWSKKAMQSYATKAKELCDKVRNTTTVPDDMLELHEEVFARFEAV